MMGNGPCPGKPLLANVPRIPFAALIARFFWACWNSFRDPFSKILNSLGFIIIHWWTLRSEEHTSELQSRGQLVCRLLLEKKKIKSEAYTLYRVYENGTDRSRNR